MKALVLASIAALVLSLVALVPVDHPGAAPIVVADEEYQETIDVIGAVRQPRRFTREDLMALPQWSMQVSFTVDDQLETAVYTGPSLLSVIEAAGGIVVDPNAFDEPWRKFVLASASDDYGAVIAWGEIDSEGSGVPIFIAHERNGEPLPPGRGMARVIVPTDKTEARSVYLLARIEVRNG